LELGHTTDERSPHRAFGAVLALGALVMIAFMALHPAIHSHDPAGFFAEMEREAALNRFVHGSLVAAMGVVLLGLLGLCDRLGWGAPLARAGLIAYALGTIAHTAAAAINGFVVTALTERYASAGPADAAFEALRPLLVMCREMNGAAARFGVFAMSAGILCWSLALLRRQGPERAVGLLGLVCGVALPLAVGFGGLAMDVHGFAVRVLAQSVWLLAAASLLLRRRRLERGA
jgi:hypothetical protein